MSTGVRTTNKSKVELAEWILEQAELCQHWYVTSDTEIAQRPWLSSEACLMILDMFKRYESKE